MSVSLFSSLSNMFSSGESTSSTVAQGSVDPRLNDMDRAAFAKAKDVQEYIQQKRPDLTGTDEYKALESICQQDTLENLQKLEQWIKDGNQLIYGRYDTDYSLNTLNQELLRTIGYAQSNRNQQSSVSAAQPSAPAASESSPALAAQASYGRAQLQQQKQPTVDELREQYQAARSQRVLNMGLGEVVSNGLGRLVGLSDEDDMEAAFTKAEEGKIPMKLLQEKLANYTKTYVPVNPAENPQAKQQIEQLAANFERIQNDRTVGATFADALSTYNPATRIWGALFGNNKLTPAGIHELIDDAKAGKLTQAQLDELGKLVQVNQDNQWVKDATGKVVGSAAVIAAVTVGAAAAGATAVAAGAGSLVGSSVIGAVTSNAMGTVDKLNNGEEVTIDGLVGDVAQDTALGIAGGVAAQKLLRFIGQGVGAFAGKSTVAWTKETIGEARELVSKLCANPSQPMGAVETEFLRGMSNTSTQPDLKLALGVIASYKAGSSNPEVYQKALDAAAKLLKDPNLVASASASQASSQAGPSNPASAPSQAKSSRRAKNENAQQSSRNFNLDARKVNATWNDVADYHVYGRSNGTLDGDYISREHAMIARTKDGRLLLARYDSGSGTKLNGQNLAKSYKGEEQFYELKPGDEVRFGDYVFQVADNANAGMPLDQVLKMKKAGMGNAANDNSPHNDQAFAQGNFSNEEQNFFEGMAKIWGQNYKDSPLGMLAIDTNIVLKRVRDGINLVFPKQHLEELGKAINALQQSGQDPELLAILQKQFELASIAKKGMPVSEELEKLVQKTNQVVGERLKQAAFLRNASQYLNELEIKLEPSETLTIDKLKEAYHKLAKRYYPDANTGDKAATEKFIAIKDAYDKLLKLNGWDTPQAKAA